MVRHPLWEAESKTSDNLKSRETPPGRPGHDVIIVGAGHNGLVCAAYLARAGLDVLVLEARSSVGGCASTVEALEGVRVNVCNCDHSLVLATPIPEELNLAGFGLRYREVDPTQLSIGWDGEPPWFLFRDRGRTLDGLGLVHPEEIDNYRRYLDAAMPAAELVLELASEPPTPARVVRRVLERRGRGARILLSWSRKTVASVVRSLFSSEALRSPVVTTGPAVWGLSPNAPGTGLGALGYAMKHVTGVARPEGGSGGLPAALAACIEAAGGAIRTGARVEEILAEGTRARGVLLRDGEVVEAPVVVAAADPRVALVRWLVRPPPGVGRLIRRWRSRPQREGYESKVDAVIGRRPLFRALDDSLLERLGVDEPLVPTTIVSPGLAEIARAHDGMARGEVATKPMFYVNVPSVLDESMKVAGDDVFSLEVLFTPYTLREGWGRTGEPWRWVEAFSTLVQPGFLDDIRRWRVVTPPDYERDFGLDRGLAPGYAGTALSALIGRDRELTRYETPVRGLYLTGAGTFPGAGIWGASGRNAAHVILSRFDRAGR
jgi:phytoene dehydrogenase-like protein